MPRTIESAMTGATNPTGIIAENVVFPPANSDFAFFYAGLQARKLLVQRCLRCHRLRNPPSPICIFCQSPEWTSFEADRRGMVYSFTIHHRPALPYFSCPHPVVLVDMKDGFRFLSSFDVRQVEKLRIGMDVVSEFQMLESGIAVHYFTCAS